MIPFEGSYPTIFTWRLKSYMISTCWPMTHVSSWQSRYVCCSPSYVRNTLTRLVLTTEATDHPQIILCLVNAGLLILVVGVSVPGDSGLISWKSPVHTLLSSTRLSHHPLWNSPSSLQACVPWPVSSFRMILSGQKKLPYIPPWNITNLQ